MPVCSAVYQEFGHYKLTLAQNVYLGDTAKEMDYKKISQALEWAGVLLADHPQELLLGREFGGTELSGGQWQRLALARSYYRQRPILFLDEPITIFGMSRRSGIGRRRVYSCPVR